MNLDQFKATLDTDARRRCDAQEKTINEQRKIIADKDNTIRWLSNRCYVFTRGAMCTFCEIEKDCPSIAAVEAKEATP